jgi:hypothetical protein
MSEIDLDQLNERAQPIVKALLELKAADPRLSVSRQDCMRIDPHGLTKQLELEASGEYDVFIDGGQKRILVASIYDRMIKAVVASYPVGAAPAKVREAKTKFRKKARPRTEAELAGLAKANEARRLEAEARRAAKQAELTTT